MIEAVELRAIVEKLQQLLALIPPRQEAIVKQTGEIRLRASALLEEIGRADAQADSLLGEIEVALRDLLDGAGRSREAVVAEIEEVAQSVLDLDAVEKGRDVLEQSADAARAAMESLGSRLDLGTEAFEQEGDTLRAALGDLKQETEDGRRTLASALEAANSAAEALRQAIDSGKQSVASTIQGVAAEIENLREQALHQLDGCLSTSDTLRQAFASRLDDVMSSVVGEPAEALVREMRQKISGELEERLDAAVGGVRAALGALVKTTADARSRAAAGCEKLGPVFDSVEGFVEPIKTVVKAIRETADTVGVDF